MTTSQQKYAKRMTQYEAMGLASLLPGMIRMRELMDEAITEAQEQLSRVKERLAGIGDEDYVPLPHTQKGGGQKAYWAAMTPEERATEMRRRGMVGRKKKALAAKAAKTGKIPGLHPRDPRHPGHEAWIKKMSKIGKRSWNSLTPEQHAERVAKTLAGRAA